MNLRINKSYLFHVLVLIIISSSFLIAQKESVQKKKSSAVYYEKKNKTQTINDKVEIKNNSGNSILTITDEGNDVGSITLINGNAPADPTWKLYNENNTLMFNGLPIGSSGATSINELSDAKYDGSSLYLGASAGFTETENDNTNIGMGNEVLYTNGTGYNNIGIGNSSLYKNTSGHNNVAIGFETNYHNQSGTKNTIIGSQAGKGISTHIKSGNVFIGYQAGLEETGSNKLYIENSSSETPLIFGNFAEGSEQVKVNGELQTESNEGVLFKGTHTNGIAQNYGAGTRFHFYPKKSALRAGYVNGTEWDDANIGNYSVAFGAGTKALGDYSTALNRLTFAQGNYSLAAGFQSEANGSRTVALGDRTKANGVYSTSLGSRTDADAYNSMAVGRFNIGGGDEINWIATDPLFEIGNGSNTSNKSNALTVLKNGNIGIGISAPNEKLEVDGTAQIKKIIVGDNGTEISEIVEITGTLSTTTNETTISYPSGLGFTSANSRIVSLELRQANIGEYWVPSGYFPNSTSNKNIYYALWPSGINIYHINTLLFDRYRIVIMKIE